VVERRPRQRVGVADIAAATAEDRRSRARGATEGGAPVTLGTTARYSLVRDPDGNWLEISQRASLTGPLPG
jgi:lactoylglutathione lyase